MIPDKPVSIVLKRVFKKCICISFLQLEANNEADDDGDDGNAASNSKLL